jgi:anti-sigma factor RsiW
MIPCRRILPLLEAFGDGELSADKAVEVEQHLTECEVCCERIRLDHAIRTSVRHVVTSAAAPSAAFEARVARALAAERQGEGAEDEAAGWNTRPLSWRAIMPLAAAAGFALFFAASRTKDSVGERPVVGSQSSASAVGSAGSVTASVDQLIDEFVSHHAMSERPEVTEPSLVGKLEPRVGVPVRLPSLSQYGARWEGASVVPVTNTRNQRAASLRYELDGHRVTLYMYNSQRFPLRVTLDARVVRNVPVYVGTRRGYSIAAVEKRGVGYAVATDLNDSESAELVVASLH